MDILVCASLDGVPAHPRTGAPVLSAPVHIACHASFGAAYRRRGGTGGPRAAGRSRAIPHVRGMGQLGYVRCPVQVPIGSPKHAHSHAEQGQKRLSACQCAWWGIVRAAYWGAACVRDFPSARFLAPAWVFSCCLGLAQPPNSRNGKSKNRKIEIS